MKLTGSGTKRTNHMSHPVIATKDGGLEVIQEKKLTTKKKAMKLANLTLHKKQMEELQKF